MKITGVDTVVVNAPASEPAPFKYLAPYSGCAMGVHWMENGGPPIKTPSARSCSSTPAPRRLLATSPTYGTRASRARRNTCSSSRP